MNDVYVLNQDFTIAGVIDEYVSLIWRPSYSDIGDFELYMGATDKAVQLLQEDRYLVRSSDISVVDGVTTYRNVMIIKNFQIITDVENGDFFNVTGKELKFLLNQRIVWRQTNLTSTAEAGIRQLVTENAIAPTDAKRVIPSLELAAAAGISDAINKQVTGEKLDKSIIDICNTYNYGWDIYISGGALILEVYQGLDRSYGQSERPYVIFSDDFENLYNTDYQLTTEEYANTALIGGEGEGLDRIYSTVGANNSGLDRYETFVDARDISQNKGNEDEIPAATYLSLLDERGLETLATLSVTEGFSGEVLSDVAFKYGVDFFLGDTVTVINKYGISKNVKVLSAIESEDETGATLIPQFNI